jgi:putative ABC transport system substrate-binding protein
VTNGIATQAAKAATSSIPILFMTGADPVEMGVVASLNRPGANLTGVTALGDSLGPKRLELLHEIAPAVTDVGALFNPGNGSNEIQLRDLTMAARTIGLQLHVVNASAEQDFEIAFATLAKVGVGGLVITTAPIFNNYAERLGSLSARHIIPAFYQYREFVVGGGLMSIGTDQTMLYRWLGIYAGRILNGEKPADLPVQQATKIELTINLKTAKALGLTVPLTLQYAADEVIE